MALLVGSIVNAPLAARLGEIFGAGFCRRSTLLPPPGFARTMRFAFAIAVSTLGYSWSQGIAAATVTQVFILGSLVAIGLALLLAAYSSRIYRDAKLLRPGSGRPT